jgi:hypothetical protein
MITDAGLVSAVEGRAHWRPTGEDSAVYSLPGQAASVRVGRIRRPDREGSARHDRYVATLIREGRAMCAASFGFASEAVAWAERVRLE